MNTMNKAYRRTSLSLATALLAGVVLSACTSIGYRCPLDPAEKPESPTACANMHDALQGAKRGAGGNTSVFLDDKGRIVPREVRENRVAVPVASNQGGSDAYYPNSGSPAFQQPKVFQVWSASFVDAEGNLHDGHHAWFATPGRWTRGSMDAPGLVGNNVLRPANPNERPQGRIVELDRNGGAKQPPKAPMTAEQARKVGDDAAMNALSQAANSAANKPAAKTGAFPVQSAAGVTAPSVQLGN